jgi:DNA polymerase-3 subunit alpha
MQEFCHLHIHSEFSTLDGFGLLPRIVDRARELEFSALAITDHASVSGFIQFCELCKPANIKPILGTEAYFVDDRKIKPFSKDEIELELLKHDKEDHKDIKEKFKIINKERKKRDHIVLLVKNEVGYSNLMQLVTESYATGAVMGGYGRILGRIDWELLERYHEGLIATTACSSGILSSPCNDKQFDIALDRTKKLMDMFGDDLYIEIMPIDMEEQIVSNKNMIDISTKMNLPLIATNDCHYINRDDALTQDILLATQQHTALNKEGAWKFKVRDLWMKSYDEMVESFETKHPYINRAVYEPALNMTIEIANKIEFKLPKYSQRLPNINIKGFNDYQDFLEWRNK